MEFIGCLEADDVGFNKLSNADKSGLDAACEDTEEELNPGPEAEAEAKFPNPWLLIFAPNPELMLFVTLLLQEVFELTGLFHDVLEEPEDMDIAFIDIDLLINVSVKFVGAGCAGFGAIWLCIICFFSCNVRLDDDLGIDGDGVAALLDMELFDLSPPMTVFTSLLLSLLT